MANAQPKPVPMRSRKSGRKTMKRIQANLAVIKKVTTKK